MRSSFADPRFARVALLLVLCAGCEAERTVTIPVVVAVPTMADDSTWLLAQCLDGVEPDTLVVDVFTFDVSRVGDPGRGESICGQCATDPSLCTRIGRGCRCTDSIDTASAIRDALLGVRFEDVPGGVPLCVRVVALDRDLGPAHGADCAPTSDRCEPTLGEAATLCVLSNLGSASESAAPIAVNEVVCRGGLRPGDMGDGGCGAAGLACRDGGIRRRDGGVSAGIDGGVRASLADCVSF